MILKKNKVIAGKDPVYNLHFGLVCLSSLLFSSSYNMLIPELPAYLSSLGGAGYKGLIISLFTLTAGISRPFSGRLTDTIGRIPVMITGSVVCIVCGLFYPLLGNVAGFLLLRLVHGFSTGFTPTAKSAYVADIIPASRWGEAMGLQGLCYSLGFALGPATGSYLRMYYSFDILFYTSSFFALLSALVILGMKETLEHREKFGFNKLRISRKDIIAPEVLTPAIVVQCVWRYTYPDPRLEYPSGYSFYGELFYFIYLVVPAGTYRRRKIFRSLRQDTRSSYRIGNTGCSAGTHSACLLLFLSDVCRFCIRDVHGGPFSRIKCMDHRPKQDRASGKGRGNHVYCPRSRYRSRGPVFRGLLWECSRKDPSNHALRSLFNSGYAVLYPDPEE